MSVIQIASIALAIPAAGLVSFGLRDGIDDKGAASVGAGVGLILISALLWGVSQP